MTDHDISHLIDIWQKRLQSYTTDYPPVEDGDKIALSECINDLLSLTFPLDIGYLPSEEVKYYLESQEADNYLSSIEAHDIAV